MGLQKSVKSEQEETHFISFCDNDRTSRSSQFDSASYELEFFACGNIRNLQGNAVANRNHLWAKTALKRYHVQFHSFVSKGVSFWRLFRNAVRI